MAASDLPARLELFCDLVDRRIGPTRVEPASDIPFHAEMEFARIGGLPVAQIDGAGLHVALTRSEIARTDEHYYAAIINLDGASTVSSRSEAEPIGPGDLFIVDTTREIASNLEHPFRQLLVKLKRPWLDAAVARPDRLHGAVLHREQPLTRLFVSHLVSGLALANQLSPAASELFARHSVALLAQALGETRYDGATRQAATREALYLRARRLIGLRLGEPGLAPAHLARTLGVSTRLLQKIFAEHGETVASSLWQERVRRSSSLLAAPDARHRSITEIAYACGFSDSAHFSRTFAAQMGTTPSQWRRRVM